MKNSSDTIWNRPDSTVTEIILSRMSAIKYVSECRMSGTKFGCEYRMSAKNVRVNTV